MGWIDNSIIVAYLVGIVVLGCWAGLRQRKRDSQAKSYFLAGGTLTWPVIGLALFSTNISTIHLVAFAQEGYVNGLAYGNFEWMAPFTLIFTALFFAPFYIRARVATLPDFLEMRYNRHCRDWLAILSIVAAVFMHIGFSLYTGAVVMAGIFGFEKLLPCIIVTAVLTGIYTVVGGLKAVVVTESIQTIILLLGAVFLTAYAYHDVGGMAGLNETLEASGETVKMTIMRPKGDASGLPWYSVLLGYPIIGIWYWCADQTIVQRVLGAKDENHARVGPLFAGFLKILPVFLFVLPGLMCYAIVQQGGMDLDQMKNLEIKEQVEVDGNVLILAEGRTDLGGEKLNAGGKDFDIDGKAVYVQAGVLYIDEEPTKDTADTYSFMIKELLPSGLRGIVAAALLAALMSTVSGSLNSIATLFSYDIVKRWRPKTSDEKLVLIGRITTVVAMCAAIAWSPYIARYSSIFQGIITLICYIAPPITTVFVWGIFWRRSSAVAAQTTLYVGSLLGLICFLIDWFKLEWWTSDSMLGSFYLFLICSGVLVAVSMVYPHQHTEKSEKLVWTNPLTALESPGWKGIGNYKLLSAVLFVTMIVLYLLFS